MVSSTVICRRKSTRIRCTRMATTLWGSPPASSSSRPPRSTRMPLTTLAPTPLRSILRIRTVRLWGCKFLTSIGCKRKIFQNCSTNTNKIMKDNIRNSLTPLWERNQVNSTPTCFGRTGQRPPNFLKKPSTLSSTMHSPTVKMYRSLMFSSWTRGRRHLSSMQCNSKKMQRRRMRSWQRRRGREGMSSSRRRRLRSISLKLTLKLNRLRSRLKPRWKPPRLSLRRGRMHMSCSNSQAWKSKVERILLTISSTMICRRMKRQPFSLEWTRP